MGEVIERMAAGPARYRLELGQRVVVDNHYGYIRFIDFTQFDSGRWVGVELDQASGKNDGSVDGISYFRCTPNHGLFVKPDKIMFPRSVERPHVSDDVHSGVGAYTAFS